MQQSNIPQDIKDMQDTFVDPDFEAFLNMLKAKTPEELAEYYEGIEREFNKIEF